MTDTPQNPSIAAPAPVIELWRDLAYRAMALVTTRPRSGDSAAQVVAWIEEAHRALASTAGVLIGSVDEAAPTPVTHAEGLAALTAEIVRAQQEADRARAAGGDGFVCPLPQIDGTPFACGCPAGQRCAVETFLANLGADAPDVEAAGDPTGEERGES